MPIRAAAGSDAAVPTLARRQPSEFAAEEPRLRRLAALPADDPLRPALRDQLIMTFLPVGEHIAARYSSVWPGAREDLRQVASVGVINAVDRWDPDRAGGDVLGFVVPSVRGEVLRYIRDRSWALRVPRRLKELTVAINRATGPLTHELGRAPRPTELARHLDVDVEEILEALHVETNHYAATLDAPGSSDARTLADRVGEADPHMQVIDDVVTLRPLLHRLPDRERRIIELRFFQDRTQTQIADEIGISQMHVSRLLARTLARLRSAMRDDDALPAAAGDGRPRSPRTRA
jgi:RNA polymerase sigma-B factor